MAGKIVSLKTDNKCHEVPIEWEIKNALEIPTKKSLGKVFAIHPNCKIKFKNALLVVKNRDDVSKLTVGFQRADRCFTSLTVITNLTFSDLNSRELTRRQAKFVSVKGFNKVNWCISEKFAGIAQKSNCSKNKDSSESDSHSISTLSLDSGTDNEHKEIKHLKGGSLIVKGILKVYGCCVDSNLKYRPSFSDESSSEDTALEVIGDFKLAYETNTYTDVCLKVSDFYIRAHKFVLSARCPYFKRLLSEAREDVIEISDMDKTVLELFLRFLYTGIVGEISFKTLTKLYSVANRYKVTSLEKKCSHTMKTKLKYSTACETLQLADQNDDEELKIFAINFIVEHFENPTVANIFSAFFENNPELASTVLKFKRFKESPVSYDNI